MNMLPVVAFLFLSTDVPKMPSPANVLLALSQRDLHAALHFCAARPALHARQGEAAASDVDRECNHVITASFHDALHLPTLRELGPSMIRALEKSPTLFYQAEPYANAYRKTMARLSHGSPPLEDQNQHRSVASPR